MQLGFVSAIVSELSLEDVLAFASDEGFACVELMCWPPGEADRRYAGVTHVDVTRLEPPLDEARGGHDALGPRCVVGDQALGELALVGHGVRG